MDLRIKKTLSAIRNAFIRIRSKKALEKITVRELAEAAEISKATFYLHYQDVYQLSETMQNEIIENVFGNIEHPEYVLGNTAEFTRELINAFIANITLIEILFSDSSFSILPMKIEERIRESVFEIYPERREDLSLNMLITYRVHGALNVYYRYREEVDNQMITEVLSGI